MKDAGLRIRVQRELRDRFIATCREQDKPAAQVLREFMQAYVGSHSAKMPEMKRQTRGKPAARGGAGKRSA